MHSFVKVFVVTLQVVFWLGQRFLPEDEVDNSMLRRRWVETLFLIHVIQKCCLCSTLLRTASKAFLS